MEKQTGGPAYPSVISSSGGHVLDHSDGMTLRDYFAGQALISLIEISISKGNMPSKYADTWAESAYLIADAMLVERGAGNDAN